MRTLFDALHFGFAAIGQLRRRRRAKVGPNFTFTFTSSIWIRSRAFPIERAILPTSLRLLCASFVKRKREKVFFCASVCSASLKSKPKKTEIHSSSSSALICRAPDSDGCRFCCCKLLFYMTVSHCDCAWSANGACGDRISHKSHCKQSIRGEI